MSDVHQVDDVDESWRDHAACKGLPTELFFVNGHQPGLTVCASCRAAEECLEYALSLPAYDDHGIWGNVGKLERDRMRRQRRQAHIPRPRSFRALAK